jgi:hypothetical protein
MWVKEEEAGVCVGNRRWCGSGQERRKKSRGGETLRRNRRKGVAWVRMERCTEKGKGVEGECE